MNRAKWPESYKKMNSYSERLSMPLEAMWLLQVHWKAAKWSSARTTSREPGPAYSDHVTGEKPSGAQQRVGDW